MISNNHVKILGPYYLFINYGIFENYSRKSMLAWLNENIIFIYNKKQEIFATTMLAFLMTSNGSVTTVYN